MKQIFSLALIISLSGCATILNDEYQKINVTSNADKIDGTIDGVAFSGPGVVEVRREGKDKIINISTPSCQKKVALPHSVDNKFFINILSGGTFGSSTDYATEKMWKYQDNVNIRCK